MEKISLIERNIDDFLNEDNLYGTFYLEEELLEMAKFGAVPSTKYEIHLEGSEGYIPHMHICVKTGKNIVLRICLLTNKYFREKDDVCNTLNSKERKALDDHLNSTYNAEFGITRWQALCMQWNERNPSHKIENIKSLQKPDYTTITE
jgi:hypothetical protein